MILMAIPGMAQQKKTVNVDSLSEKKRTEYLTKVAEKVVKHFGPGYYRKIRPLVIDKITITPQDTISPPYMKREFMGRTYYRVRFPYDENYEFFPLGYAAEVIIWADTGIAYSVVFGNEFGVVDINNPKIYNDSRYIMQYEWQPPETRELYKLIHR